MADVILLPAASPEHGLGHIRRCQAIAAWCQRINIFAEVLPLDVAHPTNLRGSLRFSAEELASAKRLVVDASVQGGDNLAKYLADLLEAEGSRSRIAVIDDPHRRWMSSALPSHLTPTVLIPHGLPFQVSAGRFHTGIGFSVPKPDLLEQAVTKKLYSTFRILVTTGGLDPKGLAASYLTELERLAFPPTTVNVVIGPYFTEEYRNSLQRLAAKSRHDVNLLTGLRNLSHVMADADIALSGGGLTKLELAISGVPTLVVDDTDYHSIDSEALAELGAVISMGVHKNVNAGSVTDAVESLIENPLRRMELSLAGRNLLSVKLVQETVRLVCGVQ